MINTLFSKGDADLIDAIEEIFNIKEPKNWIVSTQWFSVHFINFYCIYIVD